LLLVVSWVIFVALNLLNRLTTKLTDMKCTSFFNRSGTILVSFDSAPYRMAEVFVEAAFGGIYFRPDGEDKSRFPTEAEMKAMAACPENQVRGNQFVSERSTWRKFGEIQDAAKDYTKARIAFAAIQEYKREMKENFPRIQHEME